MMARSSASTTGMRSPSASIISAGYSPLKTGSKNAPLWNWKARSAALRSASLSEAGMTEWALSTSPTGTFGATWRDASTPKPWARLMWCMAARAASMLRSPGA
ncbi:hypothetical protein D3C72_1504910 [compost metagenome]